MGKRKDTRTDLVEELLKLPQSDMRDAIIAEAKAGEYHDYKNQKYACGKVAVVGHLRNLSDPKADALAQRVIDGEFDEEADAEDLAYLREICPPALRRALKL
jgi:hypothetical protein